MATELNLDPDLEWLDHVQPVGLVVASSLLKELGLTPTHQAPLDTAAAAEVINDDPSRPGLRDPLTFVEQVLGWRACEIAGAPGGAELAPELTIRLANQA